MAESKRILSVIMGGGRGTRLFPLTKERCKPAVPLAGKYRLVDIPISNCLNSGCNRIFVLSQFLTASLHRHIQKSYQFDPFGGGFIDILSAEQTEKSNAWYEGTADAVRRNLVHFHRHGHDFVLILSGDQLYRMDFGQDRPSRFRLRHPRHSSWRRIERHYALDPSQRQCPLG